MHVQVDALYNSQAHTRACVFAYTQVCEKGLLLYTIHIKFQGHSDPGVHMDTLIFHKGPKVYDEHQVLKKNLSNCYMCIYIHTYP